VRGEGGEGDVAVEAEPIGEGQHLAEDGERPEQGGVADELRGRRGAERAGAHDRPQARQQRLDARAVSAEEDDGLAGAHGGGRAVHRRVDELHALGQRGGEPLQRRRGDRRRLHDDGARAAAGGDAVRALGDGGHGRRVADHDEHDVALPRQRGRRLAAGAGPVPRALRAETFRDRGAHGAHPDDPGHRHGREPTRVRRRRA
jgi:hypothetical protein